MASINAKRVALATGALIAKPIKVTTARVRILDLVGGLLYNLVTR